MKRLLSLVLVTLVLVVGCVPSGPESAARAAFVQWADTINRVPYQNVQVTTLENDETFATVKITAEFRADKDAPWMEQETKTNCKKVGQEWQCEQIFSLTPTARGIATATANAQAVAALATATSQVVRTQLHDLGKIAFAGKDGIYVMDSDGSNLRQISNHDRDTFPSWSPDGKRIAFTSNREGNDEIYVMNDDGTNVLQLTDSEFGSFSPTWSPDSKQIAFQRGSQGLGSAIWVMDSLGKNPQQLTDEYSLAPSWSPDGRFIAFIGARKVASREIYLLEIATKNIRWIADSDFHSRPAWSPNGSFIAFCATADEFRPTKMFVIEVNTGNRRQLGDETTGCFGPAWSPDGNWIAFASAEIFVADRNGKNMLQLTHSNSSVGVPAWSPQLSK